MSMIEGNGGMSAQEMMARIAALEAANAKLRVASSGKLSMKVSEKGAVSVYGLGQFPVTLYGSQWDRLLAASDQIKAYMDANRDRLTVKGDKPKAAGE